MSDSTRRMFMEGAVLMPLGLLPQSHPHYHISNGVMREAIPPLLAVANGARDEAHYASAAVALRIMFANWDEAGLSASIGQKIASARPTTDNVHRMYKAATLAGLNMDESTYLSFVDLGAYDKLVATVDEDGVESLHQRIIAIFQSRADALRTSGSTQLRNARQGGGIGPDFCAAMTILGLYLAVIGLLVDLGIITIPLGAAISALGVLIAAIGLICL